jgi:transposase
MNAMLSDPLLSATEAGLRAGLSNAVGAKWVRRFNADGLAGLDHRLFSGRPRTHSKAARSVLIALALQKPQTLGYPFAMCLYAVDPGAPAARLPRA